VFFGSSAQTSSAGDVTAEQMFTQRLMINNEAAAQVEKETAPPHLGELFGTEQTGVTGSSVHVQGDRLRNLEQLVECLAAPSIAERQLVCDVVEIDPHADRLGYNG
jgi:hypothetical protein